MDRILFCIILLCLSFLQESKYFHMSYEGGVASLAIAELYAEDEGEYTCRATNSAGTVETHSDIFVQGISPCHPVQ